MITIQGGTRMSVWMVLLACAGILRADSVVVFNEIMYHPPERESELEWIELHNQLAVRVDLSGWSLAGGIDYLFPAGTLIEAEGYLVVAVSPLALAQQTGFTEALGPFSGRLSNSGESIRLLNNSGRTMDRVDYSDSGEWPIAPDGSGVSLAKLDEDRASGDARSWAWSEQMEGTPGRPNGVDGKPAKQAIRFNEMSASTANDFWIEWVNAGETPFDLVGCQLVNAAQPEVSYAFESRILMPSDHLVIAEPLPSARPQPGDTLLLYGPNRDAILDAILVEGTERAKAPDGRWYAPLPLTPGTANRFGFHDEIVINEIMYHAPPRRAQTATHQTLRLLAPGAAIWAHVPKDDSLGLDWTGGQEPFDDSGWRHGPAVVTGVGYEIAPADYDDLIRTDVLDDMLGSSTTIYLRIPFQLTTPPEIDRLLLKMKYDDGFVAYLNGVEIARANAPEDLDWQSSATSSHSDSLAVLYESFDISAHRDLLRAGTNVLAIHGLNRSATSSDLLFFPEIEGIQTLGAGRPFQDSEEAWVELYNRSDHTVDLSGWRFGEGIDYLFPSGTELSPDAYLVVSADANALRARYPDRSIIGDFDRRLSRKGERILLLDALGLPADDVTYYDQGYWPAYADGGGSSLELRDPHADNSQAQAWAASDAAAQSSWTQVRYRGKAETYPGSNYPTVWNEFVFGLLDGGEFLIDDISVIEDPCGTPRELIQEGNFSRGLGSWRFLGNHQFADVVPDPENPADSVLHVTASGALQHNHNHIETTLAQNRAIVDGREYQVSYRARWLGGSNQLNTRLYFNRLARTTLIDIPLETGTPGLRNSRFQDNIGPTMGDLSHHPVVPAPNEEVEVTVRIADPDGLLVTNLLWSSNEGPFQSTLLEPLGDDRYRARIAGFPAGTLVQFYVEAFDGLAAYSVFPPGGRDSRALFQVDDGRARGGVTHNLRMLIPDTDSDRQQEEANLLSNHRIGATLIYKERDVYYDVAVRLKGSGYGRQIARSGFNVRFRPDQLFQGVHDVISIDRNLAVNGRHRELVFKHIGNQAGDLPSVYDDMAYLNAATEDRMNGPAQLFLARFDDEYLDSVYANGGSSELFELEIIYYNTSTIGGNPEGLKPRPNTVLDTDFGDMGNDKEAYRWNYLLKNHRGRDNFEAIMAMAQTFSLEGEAFARRIEEVIDVDQWMRFFAYQSLGGVGDTYNQSHTHNLKLFVRPDDKRVVCLPWDTDRSFSNSTNSSLFGSSGSRLQKILAIPKHRRRFLWHCYDLITTSFNTDYMEDWVRYYAEAAGTNATNTILSAIGQRRSFALGQLPEPVPFSIDSSGDISRNEVTLRGEGWLDVAEIRLAGSAEALPIEWSDVTTWSAVVPIPPTSNQVVLEAYGSNGQAIGSESIVLSSRR